MLDKVTHSIFVMRKKHNLRFTVKDFLQRNRFDQLDASKLHT